MSEDTREETLRLMVAPKWSRLLLLGLILGAFLRLTWALDAKALWWDESLTLQRAESALLPLLNGTLLIKDGFTELPTTDQHPFLYFLLTGILIRVAGDSEYVLRFVSVMAGTALVPMVWLFGSKLVKSSFAAKTTALWAALLAAISPFFLWYGQEARPYTLWALLAILSTYVLWRALQSFGFGAATAIFRPDDNGSKAGAIPFRQIFISSRFALYIVTLFLFLLSQYYAAFLLPLHGLMIWVVLAKYNRRIALLLAAGMAVLGIALGGGLGWYLLSRTGGENFRQIPLEILLPDMLNAFSMGLSVDINQVWWLDVAMGVVALLGVAASLRLHKNWSHYWSQGGWILPGLILIPVVVLLIINSVHPAYMNARHISLIGGGYILALGAGLGLLFQWQRWVAILVALMIVVGSGYSTVNYFTQEEYQKDDYRRLASYIEQQMQPGDLIILNPAASWRIFEYYLPLERINQYNARVGNPSNSDETSEHLPTDYYQIPLLGHSFEQLFERIDEWKTHYRRVWVIKSGTNPFMDREEQIDPWLDDKENIYRLSEKRFFSHSALRASLYMAVPPVFNEPIPVEGIETDILFGEEIRLIGVDIGEPLTSDSPLPVALYWQTVAGTDKRYKSILSAGQQGAAGEQAILGVTEREPYDGIIATEYWAPHQTIIEWSEIAPISPWPESLSNLNLQIQLYPTDSQEKQTITINQPLPDGVSIGADGTSVVVVIE